MQPYCTCTSAGCAVAHRRYHVAEHVAQEGHQAAGELAEANRVDVVRHKQPVECGPDVQVREVEQRERTQVEHGARDARLLAARRRRRVRAQARAARPHLLLRRPRARPARQPQARQQVERPQQHEQREQVAERAEQHEQRHERDGHEPADLREQRVLAVAQVVLEGARSGLSLGGRLRRQ